MCCVVTITLWFRVAFSLLIPSRVLPKPTIFKSMLQASKILRTIPLSPNISIKKMKKLEKIITSQPWLHIRITWGAVKKKKKKTRNPKPEPNNHFSPSKNPWVRSPDLNLIFNLHEFQGITRVENQWKRKFSPSPLL